MNIADRLPTQGWLLATVVGVRGKLSTRTGQRILKNVAALSIAQAATYLLPLIVLPYTAVVLGPKLFGIIALLQAIVQYSTLITNYGFSFSATRRAAMSQNNPAKLADIVVHVWTAKSLIMIACLAISMAIFAVIPTLPHLFLAYLCAFVTVIGNVLYLDWFFQAIEEMKWITVINVVPKLILTPMIFVVVKAPADYPLVLLIQSAAFLVSGVAGAVLARRCLHVTLPRPTRAGVVAELKDGWRTFVTTVSINLYTTTNIVILGAMTDATIVGYYSAGQKVVTGIQSVWTPVSQALYPQFCKSFQSQPARAGQHVRRLALTVFGVTWIGASIVSICAPHLIPLYLGASFNKSVRIIQILIFSVCAIWTSNVLGVHGMLAAGLYTEVSHIVSSIAVFSLVLAPIAIFVGGHLALASVSVAIELAVCYCYFYTLRSKSLI